MHGLDPGQIGTSTSRRVGKVLGKKSVSVFQRTCSEIQLTLKDSCVRVAVRGGWGGTRSDDKYKRFTGSGSVRCTVEIVLGVL